MRRLLPLLLLAGPLVRGAELTHQSIIVGPTSVALRCVGKNTDSGAVYNSMSVGVFSELAAALFDLSSNSATYGSAQALMDSWPKVIGTAGTVSNGWFLTTSPDLKLLVNHIAGDAGFDYDEMSSGQTINPVVSIPSSQLELNTLPGYQPFTLSDVLSPVWDPGQWDAIIVLSDSPLLAQRNLTRARPPLSLAAAFVGMEGIFSYTASSVYYELLVPGDFAGWTEFASEHPSLDPAGDANHNGRSNFLDYASGQDPEAGGLLPPVELHGSTLTLRQRINGLDAEPVAEYSDDLDDWFPLEEGVHYSVQSESVEGVMRTWVLDLLSVPPTRFFRQRFGP
ncbi:MAG: hypothetical protein H7A49_09830 [Akkermansiaceae bacterium]|nr:hypothetical protein [Akkermansiaceae bacterium]MCP5544191.1 hypothetical protein [Akkermansiaceae bacterium]MCP5548703.1 hypothetical protein [Akkermansiaceae bacterium]